jgi:hypothetical protein
MNERNDAKTMTRREFLKFGGASLALLALPSGPLFASAPVSEPPPASLGRIATWWRQSVCAEAAPGAEVVTTKGRDEIIPLYAAVAGEAPWPSNPIWYRTAGGYIHSGYVQPVENAPQDEVVADVGEPGFWAQVCVPIAEARWRPTSSYAAYKLYYGTVYRVVGATMDDDGNWWYQIQEGVTWSPGPYVPTQSVRRIPSDQLAPISPGRADKWIQIGIADQALTCFEREVAVFRTRISSGVSGLGTPLGDHRVLYQRHTQRMIGGTSDDRYDLPGVAFPVYFTWSGVAIHGTYWHNDYGRPHSHGCINVTNEAAQWIFRWAEPAVPYDQHTLMSSSGEGTRVVVVA